MPDRFNVALYGLGGIGSFYAFILSRCDNIDLTVFARSNYEVVKQNGINLKSQNHGEHLIKPFKVLRNPNEAQEPFDYIVCCHKAIDQVKVAEQLQPVITNQTSIVIIQNGVGNEDPFRQLYPECTIISCVTWTGATQTSPGVVEHIKAEGLEVGLFPNSNLTSGLEASRLDDFARMLEKGGTIFKVVPNIQIQRWEKVVWNAAWNSLTTLTMQDTKSWLGSSEHALPLTKRLMKEIIDIGQRLGIPLESELVDRLIDKIMALPTLGTSMQLDCKMGRPLEIDVILGVPYRKGKELGLAIPTLETIYVILLSVDDRLKRNQSQSKSGISS